MAGSADGTNRRAPLTDERLREEVRAGRSAAEIAARHGRAKETVERRLRRLGPSPTGSRREPGAVIDAMAELTRCLQRIHLLQDACDVWLRDADDSSAYDLTPRAEEILVTYVDRSGERPVRRKQSLAALLARSGLSDERVEVHVRAENPRRFVLGASRECRQLIAAATELGRLLADVRVMERFREAVLAEIARQSPESARAISEAVRRGIMVAQAAGGAPALPDRAAE